MLPIAALPAHPPQQAFDCANSRPPPPRKHGSSGVPLDDFVRTNAANAAVDKHQVTAEEACRLLGISNANGSPLNDLAKTFYHVKVARPDVRPFSPERGPHGLTGPPGEPMEAGTYEYLLEVDGDDRVVGGQWLNELTHDFMGLPRRNA